MAIKSSYRKTGIVLCTIYLALTTVFVAFALATSDPKGRFVLLQIPIAQQDKLVRSWGLGWLLEDMSWVTAYALLVPATLIVLYIAGLVLNHMVSGLCRIATGR